MTVPVSHIADIRMGVTLRGRDATRPAPDGSCRMIRIGDLSDDGKLVTDDLLRFEPGEPIRSELRLRRGDVLLPNRGTRTTAHVFDLPLRNVIVGSQFYILRPDESRVSPAYLAWFLRTDQAAAHFALRRKGTLVVTLQRRDVLELELPLPPLETQELIVALAALAVREREIAVELDRKKATYLQHRMLRAASVQSFASFFHPTAIHPPSCPK